MKAWVCRECGAILGRVRRNGSGVRQLMLYREAIDGSGEGDMADVDVIAVVEGYATEVKCSLPGCGATRTWMPGQEALDRIIERCRRGQRGHKGQTVQRR